MTGNEFLKLLEGQTGHAVPERVSNALLNYPAARPIERRHAAKLLHLFVREVYGLPDLQDVSAARELVDLYDCRTCAEDIAQIYVRGFMKAARYPEFGTMDRINEAEAAEIVAGVRISLNTNCGDV